jgi:hypothetical protein
MEWVKWGKCELRQRQTENWFGAKKRDKIRGRVGNAPCIWQSNIYNFDSIYLFSEECGWLVCIGSFQSKLGPTTTDPQDRLQEAPDAISKMKLLELFHHHTVLCINVHTV